ncbi:1-phosphofructokinase family hexose kinase [Leekyejoonella antrihumi]|uniref:1-phosphofructokinase family hexose kinase n=1 Tax=Leekyejoonella antrihumi TaxID=1660198 RepID=A0A563E1V6_9MICO|nr:1-phosphofructokinase family hexose kinase [Leekyejoonella antrihumi]TWP36530.1 1-phosphofructokinase family hexose kinase [Leekyejoonella antrihumi]
MIVTLTTNPCVDRTLEVSVLKRGQVNRAVHSTLEAGGKGVNVSRALLAHGAETAAVLPTGGPSGRLLTLLLADAEVFFTPVPIRGVLRVNTTVVESDGTTTKLNETGPTLSGEEAFGLLAATDDLMGNARWLAVCGSLAPGLPPDFYAVAVRRAHTYGVHVALDVSGTALERALPAGPDLIAPNRVELAEIVGTNLETLGQVRSAAEDLVRSGIPTVIVSLGRDGALLVTDGVALHARANRVRTVSTVSAGDSLLAGVLHAADQGLEPSEILSTGVQWGTAAVRLSGSRVPSPTDIADLSVTVTDCSNGDLALTD